MKAFITVMGKDRVGIIASVSTLLSKLGINIEDISQTVLQGLFTMIMAVDISKSTMAFSDLVKALKTEGEKLGVEINIRNEEIFNAMHRI